MGEWKYEGGLWVSVSIYIYLSVCALRAPTDDNKQEHIVLRMRGVIQACLGAEQRQVARPLSSR
jgi:hypothetical protein